jgi:uncharacterized protein YqgV (UPF0045/DUF77 family)
MTDILDELFGCVATDLRSEVEKIAVYGEYPTKPAVFPCVTFEESDNYPYVSSLDSSFKENHTNLMYSVNAYSNKTNGKLAECRAIIATIDNSMMKKGFLRKSMTPIRTDNAEIRRIAARYEAVVSKNKTVYQK